MSAPNPLTSSAPPSTLFSPDGASFTLAAASLFGRGATESVTAATGRTRQLLGGVNPEGNDPERDVVIRDYALHGSPHGLSPNM